MNSFNTDEYWSWISDMCVSVLSSTCSLSCCWEDAANEPDEHHQHFNVCLPLAVFTKKYNSGDDVMSWLAHSWVPQFFSKKPPTQSTGAMAFLTRFPLQFSPKEFQYTVCSSYIYICRKLFHSFISTMDFEDVMFVLYLYLHCGWNVVKVCGFVENTLLNWVHITSLSSLQCTNSVENLSWEHWSWTNFISQMEFLFHHGYIFFFLTKTHSLDVVSSPSEWSITYLSKHTTRNK